MWDLLAMLVLVIGISTRVILVATAHSTPQLPSQDEEAEVFRSLRIGAGEHRPPHALWGAFSAYTTAASLGVYYAGGRLTGRFSGTDDFIREYIVDSRAMVTTGRINAALAGIALAFLVWRLARRLAGDRCAFVATALVTLHPGLHDFSAIAKGDGLAMALGTAAILIGIGLPERPTMRRALLTGLLLGLAIGTKYHMALYASALVIPLWTSPSNVRARLTYGLGAATLVAFIASNPHCVLSAEWWWFGENGALAIFRPSVMDPRKLAAFDRSAMWTGWVASAGGVAPSLLLLAGLAIPIVERSRAVATMWLAAALFVLAMGVRNYSEPHHFLPVVPLLAVLVGCIAERTTRASPSLPRLAVPSLIAVAGLVFGIPHALSSCRVAALPDTRTLAKFWIEENIPEGEHLLVDWYYTPRLYRSREDITRELEDPRGVSPARRELLRRQLALDLRPAYRQTLLVQRMSERQRASEATHFELDRYLQAGARVAITSDAWHGRFFGSFARPEDAPVREFYVDLRQRGELMQRFAPSPDHAVGPTIEVFRLRSGPR